MKKDKFTKQLFKQHKASIQLPSPQRICLVFDKLLGLLFPELSNKEFNHLEEINLEYQTIQFELYKMLMDIKGLKRHNPKEVVDHVFNQLPTIYDLLQKDAQSISDGDPAAHSINEVIRTYPGFKATAYYRFAHVFYTQCVPYIPRILTEHVHEMTGIDIHPGAKIGEYFCIDHGTGVVIGETTIIGNNVKIYQGVTLGALSVEKNMAKTQRHPTIEDYCVIYAGATILGGETIIGERSIIGGNVWITKSVDPDSRIYYRGNNL